MTTKINLTKQQKKDVLRLVRGYELQNEKTDLENDKENLDREIKLIQSEIQQLEHEKEEIERENASITQGNKKLQTTVRDLKKKLVKMKSQKSMAQIQKIQSFNAIEDARNEEENLKEQKKILTSFIDVISTPKKKRSMTEVGNDEEEEEEEVSEEFKEDSKVSHQLEKLNQEVADRCNEISNLKTLLDNSTNLIKKLQSERNEILKTISSPKSSEKSGDKSKKTQKKRTLNNNLDDLASQIISQNEAISKAIKEEQKRSEKVSKPSTPKQKVVKREATISPRQQQQQQQSGLQVAYVINSLQQQVNSLTEENEKLKTQLTEAEDERETIFMSLGISKYNTEEDDQKETGKLDKQADLITKEIQRLKEELSQRLEEVSILKKNLEESTNTAMQLSKEHDEVIKLIEQQQEEESEYSNHTSLLENLDELVFQIESQNQTMNKEISIPSETENSSIITSPSQHKRVPFKRPQSSITEAFKKLTNDLKEANQSNLQKDERIEELEESEKTHQKLIQQLTQRIQQLADEHQSIMQALYGGDEDESDGLNGSELIENLNSLNTSISMQNEKINSAIISEQKDDKTNYASPITTLTPNRRSRPQRPQNQVIAALKKIRQDLKEVTESNFDKEQRIEELEAQLREIQETNEHQIKERSIQLELENTESEEKINELTKRSNEFEAECISSREQIQFLTNEIQKLSRQLHDVESSVKRARSLLGIPIENDTKKTNEDGSLINFADDLEAQLMTFITKSASEQSGNFTDLERRVSKLTKENEQLKSECKALNFEKNSVLSVLGILDGSAQASDSDEVELAVLHSHNDSPLFATVQKMTKTVEDQLEQIDELKQNLLQAARTIQQLSNERNSFMQALLPGEKVTDSISIQADSATKKLFRNLEALGLQISKQNDDMNSAMNEKFSQNSAPSSSNSIKSPRRERERIQRPQNLVISALNKIRNQLESAQQEISEKEIKIAELENEIEKLQK